MSDIDRFDWVADGDGDYYMSASPSGDWVKFEAHEARVITLERALREAREFIVVVECEEGLTTDNLIGQIDAALNGESK